MVGSRFSICRGLQTETGGKSEVEEGRTRSIPSTYRAPRLPRPGPAAENAVACLVRRALARVELGPGMVETTREHRARNSMTPAQSLHETNASTMCGV